MAAVLIAEPEPERRDYLEHHLRSDGFDVRGTAQAGEALELAERSRPDLVLVSTGLEGGSGLEICRRLREGEPGRAWNRTVPVIVLGESEADAVDRVRAFNRGCDDYLERPFHYEELLARIRAVLRRATPPAPEMIEAGEIEVDAVSRTARVGSKPLALSAKEFELLSRLASEPTRVFRKEELLREVWGFSWVGCTRTVDSHASRVRRKIAVLTETPYVLNRWGVGYSLMLPA